MLTKNYFKKMSETIYVNYLIAKNNNCNDLMNYYELLLIELNYIYIHSILKNE